MLFFAFGSALIEAISDIWAYLSERYNYIQGTIFYIWLWCCHVL